MKHLFRPLFLILMLTVFLPHKALSVNDSPLVTEIKVIDNDSSFRYLYLYDNQGKKVLEMKYFLQDSTWIRKSLNEWIYSGDNCITSRERIWYDNTWVMTYTIDYEYNNNLLVLETHNIFNNGIASLFKKVEFQYHTGSILTSKKEFDRQSNAWLLTIENDMSYTDIGKTDSLKTTVFQSGNIQNQLLSTFNYNSDGSLQSELLQEMSGSEWHNSEIINWFYLSNSNSIESIRNKKWMSGTSSWENTQRIDYQYNGNKDLISEIYQHWSTMFWKNDIRYDYEYDTTNKLLKKTLLKPIYNDWRGLVSINYSNFAMNKANDIDSRYEFWGGITGDLTTSYIPYMFNDEQTVQKGRSLKLSYIPVTETEFYTPVENSIIKLIPVYPNPSEGIFYINTEKYNIKSWKVSNLNGQVLKQEELSFQSGVIDISEFPKGVYILYATTPDEQLIQKLIKK